MGTLPTTQQLEPPQSPAQSPAVIRAQAAVVVDILHLPTKVPFQDDC